MKTKLLKQIEQLLSYTSIFHKKSHVRLVLFLIFIGFFIVFSLIIIYREAILNPHLRQEFKTTIIESKIIVIVFNKNEFLIKADSLKYLKKELQNITWQNNHKYPNCLDTIEIKIDNKKIYYLQLEKIPIWNSLWVYKKDKKNNLHFIGIIDTKILNKFFYNCN